MRGICWSLLVGLATLAVTAALSHAQFIIPDVSKTIINVPEPNAVAPSVAPGSQIKSSADAVTPPPPDPRCARLPETLRLTTPGCH
jgi:hypothetical protein